jgi:hypothetical protein
MSEGGLWSEAGRRLRTNRAAVVAGGVLVLLVLASLLAPLASRHAIDRWTGR